MLSTRLDWRVAAVIAFREELEDNATIQKKIEKEFNTPVQIMQELCDQLAHFTAPASLLILAECSAMLDTGSWASISRF